ALVGSAVVARGQRDVPGDGAPLVVAQLTPREHAPQRILDRHVVVAVDLAPQRVHLVPHDIRREDVSQLLVGGERASIGAVDDDMVPATGVRAVAADEERRHGELTREVRERIALGAMDPVRAQVDTIARFHAAADPMPALEDDDIEATLGQGTRSRESRHAGAYAELQREIRAGSPAAGQSIAATGDEGGWPVVYDLPTDINAVVPDILADRAAVRGGELAAGEGACGERAD